MRASIQLARDDDARFTVGHGAILGRLSRADVPLPDPRVSEAHALISFRGEAFHLLALRGRFVVDGRVQTDIVLQPALRVEVAPHAGITVQEVTLPPTLIALRAPGLPPVPLDGVLSLTARPRPEARAGFRADASAHAYLDGGTTRVVRPDAPPRSLAVGDTFDVDGVPFTVDVVPLSALSSPRTRADGFDSPLRVIARYDAVHIQRQGRDTLTLSGISARLLAELVALGGTAPWPIVATEVWSPDEVPDRLRHRLDVTLARLRAKLREARIRPDLVQLNGCGQVELVLRRDDILVDEI